MTEWMLRKPSMSKQRMSDKNPCSHFSKILSTAAVSWMLSSSVHAYPGTEVSSQSPCPQDSTGFIQAGARKICIGPTQTSTSASMPEAAGTQRQESNPQMPVQPNAELNQ